MLRLLPRDYLLFGAKVPSDTARSIIVAQVDVGCSAEGNIYCSGNVEIIFRKKIFNKTAK